MMSFLYVLRSAARTCKCIKRALRRTVTSSATRRDGGHPSEAQTAVQSCASMLPNVVICDQPGQSLHDTREAQCLSSRPACSFSCNDDRRNCSKWSHKKQKRTSLKRVDVFSRLLWSSKKGRSCASTTLSSKDPDAPSRPSLTLREKEVFSSRDRRALVALGCSGPDASSALDNAINEILEQNLHNQGISERAFSFCFVDLDG